MAKLLEIVTKKIIERRAVNKMDLYTAIYASVFYSYVGAATSALTFIIMAILPQFFKNTITSTDPIFSEVSKRLTGLHVERVGGAPAGWIIGRWYVAHATIGQKSDGDNSTIIIWCADSFLKFAQANRKAPVKIFTSYSTVTRYINPMKEMPAQAKIIDAIVARGDGAYLIWGEPGAGKTMVSYLLAMRTGKVIWDGYNYDRDAHMGFGGSIIPIDECDQILDTIIGEERKLSELAKESRQKMVWTRTLDGTRTKGYILLLTMNTDPAKYDAADSALLRRGRITQRFQMFEPIPVDDN